LQPVCGSQLSLVQALLSSQASGAPFTQIPPLQVSAPSQALPLLQDMPSVTAVCTHLLSVVKSQRSSVHGLPSSHVSGQTTGAAPHVGDVRLATAACRDRSHAIGLPSKGTVRTLSLTPSANVVGWPRSVGAATKRLHVPCPMSADVPLGLM